MRSFFPAQGDAALCQLEPSSGDLLALGAAHEIEQLGGGVDSRGRAGESRPSEELRLFDGGSVELRRRPSEERRGGLRLGIPISGRHVALVVGRQSSPANAQAKLLVHARDRLGIRAVFVVEPELQTLVLSGAQLLQLGIGAHLTPVYHGIAWVGGSRSCPWRTSL